MQTVTIDIINEKALPLLKDLELLQLIRLRREPEATTGPGGAARYKGAMTKQPLAEIEKQLHEMRNEWD